MADFILHRKISVYTYPPYPFPEYAFQIYGNGKFYNGFSIGDTSNLSVVNKDGVLKFSRGAANGGEMTSVILGTIPENSKSCIWIDIASPLSQNMDYFFAINGKALKNYKEWTTAQIANTNASDLNKLRAGGVLTINFKSATALQAIPDLLAARAIWLK